MSELVTKNEILVLGFQFPGNSLYSRYNKISRVDWHDFGLFLFELIDNLAYGSSKINHNDPTVAKMDL